ncbi:MAG: restriction endonuclease [Gammaproteobacteria bacterium]|nr:restriction endonuclease [Gammaproteobacteria bacterium]MDE0412673.1 restriction endonuclease [Gammaproteobacteria bacterium]
MSIGNYESIMLPTLKALADGLEAPLSEIRTRIAVSEKLTEQEVSQRLPSGRQTVLVNRMGWALLGLQRAGLVKRVRRAVYQLTNEGNQLLGKSPEKVDCAVLRTYPAYAKWEHSMPHRQGHEDTSQFMPTQPRVPSSEETPEEQLERAAEELRITLESEVLNLVRGSPPEFLERVIVDLLVAMGYGGGDAAKSRVTGRSGDGGIDGTIREDALGLDEVYVQAKKYAEGSNVGEGDLRNFAGAIDAAGTSKGVFVTTAGFTRSAQDYIARSPKRIILIDGEELARLMVQHGVGVRTRDRYEVKRVDEDYFDQEEL